MKRRIYPTLRPPVEDEPIREEAPAPPRISEVEATTAARAYRCPSHGRNPRAKASPDGDDWRFEGLCCREAEAEVRALLKRTGPAARAR
jgi:hypothetical protein